MKIGHLPPSILCWGSMKAEMPHWSHVCQEELVSGCSCLLEGVCRKRNSTYSRKSFSPSQSSLGKRFLFVLSFNLFSLSQSWNILGANFTNQICVDLNMLVKLSNPPPFFFLTNMAGKGRTKNYVIRSVLHGLIPCCMFHLVLPLFSGILSSWAFKENGIFQRVSLAIAAGPTFCALTSCLIKLVFNSLIQDTGCHLMSLPTAYFPTWFWSLFIHLWF